MPYIASHQMRRQLDKLVSLFRQKTSYNTTGNLNYFLFRLAKESCDNYASYRDFIGELEAAKLEIYRRQIATYEDEKIKINGDVE